MDDVRVADGAFLQLLRGVLLCTHLHFMYNVQFATFMTTVMSTLGWLAAPLPIACGLVFVCVLWLVLVCFH